MDACMGEFQPGKDTSVRYKKRKNVLVLGESSKAQIMLRRDQKLTPNCIQIH